MLDIGWTELLIIGVVALVVVGPKDLPKMFRTLGQLTGKARAMAREFQRAMDAAADETGVKDMARDLRDTASGRKFKEEMGLDELDRDMRAMGRPDQWGSDSKKPGARTPETVAQRKAREADGGEAEDDAAMAAEHDAEMAARNKKTSALEAERLKAADRAAAARKKAAEIRARRDAEAASGSASASATPAAPEAPGTGAAAASGDGAPVGKGAARKPARPARRQDPEAET